MRSKLLIDLDGTILNGSVAINEAARFFLRAEEEEIEFLVMTNSVKSPWLQKKRLADAGVAVPLPAIINPVIAINSYMNRKGIASAYITGSEQEKTQVCVEHNDKDPEIILLLDFERDNASYEDLQRIFELQQKGVPMITASISPFYLSEGRKKLDTGAFVRLFESASDSEIEVFGKPSPLYYREALAILDCRAEEVLVIGDDWRTDVRGAMHTGCRALLMRSGKYKAGDENNVPGVPVIGSLMDAFEYFE